MGLLSKDAILSADDLKQETVPVPEWGGDVIVRCMTGKERDTWEAQILAARDDIAKLGNVRATLCALCICDESGERLFSDSEIETLGGKSAAALDRIWDRARALNAITQEDAEELEGKDDASPSGKCGSSSPVSSAAA